MRYFEDFPIGEIFEFKPYIVNEEAMLSFANAFDTQCFHTDKEAAEESIFGGLIASGWYTCAIFMRMQCDSYLLDSACIASPGVDELRWLAPVRAGDILTGTNEIIGKEASKTKLDRGLISSRVKILNQANVIVMTLISRAFYEKRPTP